MYKVNGVSPPVGADAYVVEEGDVVLWYYATFGPTGGPPTLDLDEQGAVLPGLPVDDTGAATPGRETSIFRVGGRPSPTRTDVICPVGHWHRLTATKDGTVQLAGDRSLSAPESMVRRRALAPPLVALLLAGCGGTAGEPRRAAVALRPSG